MAFPPPAAGQLSISTRGRRYYFYPSEFPLYASAWERRSESTPYTSDEVAAVINHAAETMRLVTAQ